MTDISFYHLLHLPLSQALPRLLEKVRSAGLRAVIRVGDVARMKELDELLWTYQKNSFLPHSTEKGKFPDQQPVYLTTGEDNPAKATVLVLVDSVESELVGKYDRVLEMFDGRDEAAVSAARDRWKKYQELGHELTYWQQTEQGGWAKKA